MTDDDDDKDDKDDDDDEKDDGYADVIPISTRALPLHQPRRFL